MPRPCEVDPQGAMGLALLDAPLIPVERQHGIAQLPEATREVCRDLALLMRLRLLPRAALFLGPAARAAPSRAAIEGADVDAGGLHAACTSMVR